MSTCVFPHPWVIALALRFMDLTEIGVTARPSSIQSKAWITTNDDTDTHNKCARGDSEFVLSPSSNEAMSPQYCEYSAEENRTLHHVHTRCCEACLAGWRRVPQSTVMFKHMAQWPLTFFASGSMSMIHKTCSVPHLWNCSLFHLSSSRSTPLS